MAKLINPLISDAHQESNDPISFLFNFGVVRCPFDLCAYRSLKQDAMDIKNGRPGRKPGRPIS
jgi:hypothetical protein